MLCLYGIAIRHNLVKICGVTLILAAPAYFRLSTGWFLKVGSHMSSCNLALFINFLLSLHSLQSAGPCTALPAGRRALLVACTLLPTDKVKSWLVCWQLSEADMEVVKAKLKCSDEVIPTGVSVLTYPSM